jgi:hypothetical protein
VDAAIEMAYERPDSWISLVVSRRQVDRAPYRGYVEGWATRDLAAYVKARDPMHRVQLCRDHGGPWQHPAETTPWLDEASALDAAFGSFKEDIDAGLRFLHIDTSVDPVGQAPLGYAIARLVDLYRRCADYAARSDRLVHFEIGFEDQGYGIGEAGDFAASLKRVLEEIDAKGLPRPTYVVAQTGTKVVEARNEGELATTATDESRKAAVSRLRALVEICREYGVLLKAHNCDYLAPSVWRRLARTGVAGANVAPEYGLVESRALIGMLDAAGLGDVRDRFLHIAHESGKWRKWVAPNTDAGMEEQAMLAGHYVYSTQEVRRIQSTLARQLGYSDVGGVRDVLREAIKQAIGQHLASFAGLET